MSDGRRNDYEIEAMCEFVQLLKYAVHDYPEDEPLRVFGRKCYLITMQRLIAESDRTRRYDSNVLADRARECAECEREGFKQCKDKAHGGKCKYSNASYKMEAIERNFGQGAFDYMWTGFRRYRRTSEIAASK